MKVLRSGFEKMTAAKVFDRLVTPSGTKIAMTADDLAQKSPRVSTVRGGAVPGQALLVAAARILLRHRTALTGEQTAPRYEIFHDVLVRGLA